MFGVQPYPGSASPAPWWLLLSVHLSVPGPTVTDPGLGVDPVIEVEGSPYPSCWTPSTTPLFREMFPWGGHFQRWGDGCGGQLGLDWGKGLGCSAARELHFPLHQSPAGPTANNPLHPLQG